MNAVSQEKALPISIAGDLTVGDLTGAIAAGWRDFRACPQYGLFFGAVFVIVGLVLTHLLLNRGEYFWLIPAMAGFPLIAPFAAAGLYEASRRRLAGERASWRPVLAAVSAGDGQLPVMGVIAFVIFAFWVILAHTVFGVFLGQSGMGADPIRTLLSPAGLGMLAVGGAIGGIIALLLFTIMVVSLPMLIDREVDFITAIITSIRVVGQNRAVMLAWAIIIALILFAAMIPALLGLLVALPVLGHATFHLYRRAVR
jgi:uncharacterized membrane protein